MALDLDTIHELLKDEKSTSSDMSFPSFEEMFEDYTSPIRPEFHCYRCTYCKVLVQRKESHYNAHLKRL